MKNLIYLLFIILSLSAQSLMMAMDTNYVDIPITIEKSFQADYMALKVSVEVENKSYSLASDACNSLINRIGKQLEPQTKDSAIVINLLSYNSLPETFFFKDYFKVRSMVNIMIRDKKALSQVLSVIRNSDTVKILSNNFIYKDYNLIYNDLIREAAAVARQRAKVYEESLGLKLELIAFSENQYNIYKPRDRSMRYDGLDATMSAGYPNTLKNFEKQVEVLDNYPEKNFSITIYFKYRIVK